MERNKDLSVEQYDAQPNDSTDMIPYEAQPIQITTIGEIRQDLISTFYQGASNLLITDSENAKLSEPVENEFVEIRHDGLIYYPQVFFRDKLNETFGRGQWALIQHAISQVGNKLCYDGSLYIRGCFVARAIGEHEYKENNPIGSWASSFESAKSDCLTRCCKDLGIAKELWQPKFIRAWIAEFAIQVQVDKNGQTKYLWRRKDQPKFHGEKSTPQEKKHEPKPQAKPEPAKTDSISEEQLKLLHTLGNKVYGKDWDAKRSELVSAVSNKKIESSSLLTKQQAQTLIDGLQKKAESIPSNEKVVVAKIKQAIVSIDNGIDFIAQDDELRAQIAEIKDVNVRKLLAEELTKKEKQFNQQ